MRTAQRGRELLCRADLGNDVEHWEPQYATYDRTRFLRKLEQLDHLLTGSVPDRERERTLTWAASAYDVYEGRTSLEPALFAYMCPTRIERARPDYGSEMFPFLPLLKYVDAEVRQLAMVGLPPFVADRYHPAPNGRRGAIVFAPVFADMFTDVGGMTRAMRVARKAVDDAAEFSTRCLDAPIGGLAASLPRITQLGRTVRAAFPVTSGHGGTVWLIARLIEEAVDDGLVPDAPRQVTVIGAGAIGTAAADLMLGDGVTGRVVLADTNQGALLRAEGYLQDRHGPRRVILADSVREAIEASDVVLSAVTSPLDLCAIDPDNTLDLEGKLLLDDSVPGSLDPAEVDKRRGMLSWVIGSDCTPGRAITRLRFNYGEAGLVRNGDLWGCEAEMGALALSERSDLVINEPVTPERARTIGKLFAEVGVEAAPFQRFGRLVSDLMLEHWPES